MRPLLAGLDTEYGFSVEGRSAKQLVEDSKALVRCYPDECFLGWDQRAESPRSDMRGFQLESLQFDPDDAKWDEGAAPTTHADREDRILANGARFYNDHGHPEYATPETWSLDALANRDREGDAAVLRAAQYFQERIGKNVRVYKNNTDFHGASYGTHESYLAQRSTPIDAVISALMPLLVTRQVLCGAGKVGSESGPRCEYQMSQRADFFADTVSAETLYRRPIFNTRDEPHADPQAWRRLHVIAGDSNMISTSLKLKVGLIKIGVWLLETEAAPSWRLSNPIEAVKSTSRSPFEEGKIDLEGSWTTARHILESYLEAADRHLLAGSPEPVARDIRWVIETGMRLLEARFSRQDEFARSVDWAAKHKILNMFAEAEGLSWRSTKIQSLDLAYHWLDEDQSLYYGLLDAGEVDNPPDKVEPEPTRAVARALAVQRFKEDLVTGSWGTLTFKTPSGNRTVSLRPDIEYGETLWNCDNVEEYVEALQECQR